MPQRRAAWVAITNSGYRFPTKKVIVNLAPASLRKEGPAFDLPIVLAGAWHDARSIVFDA